MGEKFTGRIQKGERRNPKGSGGFQDRPQDINRSGLSSEAKTAYYRAAEVLAKANEELANAFARAVNDAGGDLEKLALIKSETNTFIKNITDRVDGTPKSSVDLSSEDGSMSPKPNRIELVAPSDDDDG